MLQITNMVNLKDLWIGDKIKISASDLVGTFEGIDNEGKAKIRINTTIQAYNQEALEVFKAEEPMDIELDLLNEEIKPVSKLKKIPTKIKNEIDLHIQVLSPEHINSHPAIIIEVQIEALQKFVQQSIIQSVRTITIIHGKGEGKLKEYVHQYLSTLPETKWKVLTNKDGATEVWFEYI